ncbi:hypothetical protein V8G54_029565 [Vigna mungo]|uniref:GRF-type domain-containing protein n=1 Tax=Vigna mungo TaxID=3915 RepID=A0AAQ3MV30_VIGMU
MWTNIVTWRAQTSYVGFMCQYLKEKNKKFGFLNLIIIIIIIYLENTKDSSKPASKIGLISSKDISDEIKKKKRNDMLRSTTVIDSDLGSRHGSTAGGEPWVMKTALGRWRDQAAFVRRDSQWHTDLWSRKEGGDFAARGIYFFFTDSRYRLEATDLVFLILRFEISELGYHFHRRHLIGVVREDASRFVVVMHNVVSGGGRGGCSNGGLICYCGMKCVVRTARTIKNRGKQFWGCPKFKNGGEDGVVETETTGNCEGKSESLLSREAMEVGWKIISDVDLLVKKFGNRLNVLLWVVCVLVLVNIVVLTVVFLG